MTAVAADLSSTVQPPRRAVLWTGHALSWIATLFLAFGTAVKLFGLAPPDAPNTIEFPAETVFALGFVELVALVLYVVPRTAVLGVVLWTGYLGGAVAVHVRVGDPLFSHSLFPAYVALFLWGGLYLREPRLRALLPIRR